MHICYDVAIVGGGINGCGIAADAAMRGLSVILIEQDDLAQQTSSASTKLIHGGLRYLEYYDFSMVKKSLDERQRLLTLAPHLVHPIKLILPHRSAVRPLWLLRLGLFLYDHLSFKNKLPKTKLVSRRVTKALFAPLKPIFQRGLSFYDACTDDARLTIANALQAALHGAEIRTRLRLIKAEPQGQQWSLSVECPKQIQQKICAKTVINAAGPWVNPVESILQTPSHDHLSLVKGSHIVVHKLYEGEQAYFLQHQDGRVIFVIPYHGYTMIGTTDTPVTSATPPIHIDPEEITYLCDLVNVYFQSEISAQQILYTWSGIRPLLPSEGKSAKALSRDYHYYFSTIPAPAVTIYGGKITTYRKLAADVVDALSPIFPNLPPSTTDKIPLPGASLGRLNFRQYSQYAKTQYSWLAAPVHAHLLATYGSRMEFILQGCQRMSDLGEPFSETLYPAEVDYLYHYEWARTEDDILWRRTKLGLSMTQAEQDRLSEYLSTLHHP